MLAQATPHFKKGSALSELSAYSLPQCQVLTPCVDCVEREKKYLPICLCFSEPVSVTVGSEVGRRLLMERILRYIRLDQLYHCRTKNKAFRDPLALKKQTRITNWVILGFKGAFVPHEKKKIPLSSLRYNV